MYKWPIEGSLKKIVVSDLKKGDRVNTSIGECIVVGFDYDKSGNVISVDIKQKRENGKGYKYYWCVPKQIKEI